MQLAYIPLLQMSGVAVHCLRMYRSDAIDFWETDGLQELCPDLPVVHRSSLPWVLAVKAYMLAFSLRAFQPTAQESLKPGRLSNRQIYPDQQTEKHPSILLVEEQRSCAHIRQPGSCRADRSTPTSGRGRTFLCDCQSRNRMIPIKSGFSQLSSALSECSSDDAKMS